MKDGREDEELRDGGEKGGDAGRGREKRGRLVMKEREGGDGGKEEAEIRE